MTHPLGYLSTAAGLALLVVAVAAPARAAEDSGSSPGGPVALFQHASTQQATAAGSTLQPQRLQPAASAAERRTALVRRTQASLTQLGFDPGPADGKLGPRTRQAIRSFQNERQLRTDGEITAALLGEIAAALKDARSDTGRTTPSAAPAARSSASGLDVARETAPAQPAADHSATAESPAPAAVATAPAPERTGGVRLIAAAEAATPEAATPEAATPEAGAMAAPAAMEPAGDAYGLGDAIAESWTIMTSLSGAVLDMVQARVADATR